MLERDEQVAAITAAISATYDGAEGTQILLFRGPPGIGKTTLLAEAVARADAAGAIVLHGRGAELEREFAFGVARQLFEPALGSLEPERRAQMLSGAAKLAGPVFGEGIDLGADPGDRLFPVMHGLYWLSANLAAVSRLVIAVDDIQWCDEQTLGWLAYLARRIADMPIVMILCVRTDQQRAAPSSLAAIIAEPRAHVHDLEPLTLAATEAILASGTGTTPAPEVSLVCQARSGGNPFVVSQLAIALAEADLPLDHPDALTAIRNLLPDGVARSVLGRLRRLSPAAVRLAQSAAVLAQDVLLTDAGALAELPARDVFAAMDELVGAVLVRPEARLVFVHSLIKEAIYNDLPPGRRMDLHDRAATLLEGRSPPERIGAHLLLCEARGDPARAATLERCATRALQRGAPAAAVRYLGRALLEQPELQARRNLLLALGAAEARVGQAAAIDHLEEAQALSASTSEIGEAVRERALALGMLGRFGEAATLLIAQIDAIRGQDPEVALQLEGELGVMGQLEFSLTPLVAERLARSAPHLTGSTEGERLVLASFAYMRSNALAPAEELVDLARRAMSGGPVVSKRTSDSAVVYMLVYVLFRAGKFDDANQLLDDALDDARKRGSMLGASLALAVRSQLQWLDGRLADAEADARMSIDAQLEAGWQVVLPIAVAVLAECLLERGDAQGAVTLFADCGLGGTLPEQATFRWAQASRGRAKIAAGDRSGGIADLLDCEREHMGARASLVLQWRADAAIALNASGESELARRLADEQLALAREAHLDRIVGVGLRTCGRLSVGEQAIDLYRESAEVLEKCGAQLEHARSRVELGAAIRRSGRRREAREPLEIGYELARSCGSHALVERARDELAASGVRLRRAALSGWDSLTPSERRVAEIAAAGQSNPEIAQSLFVARKTVEMHLGNVYRKLNVTGRDELASAFEEQADRVPS